jgi:hypothetical protein
MNFDFPEAIAQLIFEQWMNIGFMPGYQPSARPPITVLTTVLENCFFASLKREEGRTTEFDLALCLPSALPEPAFRFSKFTKLFVLVPFESRKLSVNELVRLAPACNPEKTVILCGYEAKNDDVHLWGIADVGWRSSGSHAGLTELRVRVISPGEMRISLHGRLLCTYKDGKILRPERALINTGCIYDFFKNTSLHLCHEVKAAAGGQNKDDPDDERDYRAMAYLFALQEIIEKIQRLKHGGCILIVPEDTSLDKLPNVTAKYPCRNGTVWNCLCGKGILHDQFYAAMEDARAGKCNAETVASLQFQREDVENGLRDSLDMLVRLTAVDGAVLMTRKFEVLGFGAVIQLPQAAEYKINRCENRDATEAREIPIESYGTRHRSAFEFCYRCNPSVAIVVSQDGGVKMVTRVGDKICFWENLSFDGSTEA